MARATNPDIMANKIVKLLKNNGIHAELFDVKTYKDRTYAVEVEVMGNWEDHDYADMLVENNFDVINIQQLSIEDGTSIYDVYGEDWDDYASIHRYEFEYQYR